VNGNFCLDDLDAGRKSTSRLDVYLEPGDANGEPAVVLEISGKDDSMKSPLTPEGDYCTRVRMSAYEAGLLGEVLGAMARTLKVVSP
jgi:hypothetical protein